MMSPSLHSLDSMLLVPFSETDRFIDTFFVLILNLMFLSSLLFESFIHYNVQYDCLILLYLIDRISDSQLSRSNRLK